MSSSGGASVPASTATPAPAQTSSAPSNRSNSRYNSRRRNGNSDNNSSNRFVPKIPTIESLASSSENKGQDFTKFQKSIHHHALTTFRNSKDMSKAILEFSDPYAEIRKDVPNLTTIRIIHNLRPSPPISCESESDEFQRKSENTDKHEMAKMLYSSQIKLNGERERDLTQNLTILWATIMGQCSPALQEEVNGDPDYITKSADFDSVWLLQTLQKITAGVNKTTNRYFSVFKATKKFYLTQQGSNENVDECYSRFDNAKDLV